MAQHLNVIDTPHSIGLLQISNNTSLSCLRRFRIN